jgi:hypothetical protein
VTRASPAISSKIKGRGDAHTTDVSHLGLPGGSFEPEEISALYIMRELGENCLKSKRSVDPEAKPRDGDSAGGEEGGACHSTLLMALSRIEGLIPLPEGVVSLISSADPCPSVFIRVLFFLCVLCVSVVSLGFVFIPPGRCPGR